MKLRRRTTHIKDGDIIRQKYTVEGLYEGMWAPVGTSTAKTHFDTKEEREDAFHEINELVNGD